jgi:hypothetical protein
LWQPLLLLLSGSSLLFFPLFAWVYLEVKMATMMVFIFSIYLISSMEGYHGDASQSTLQNSL